jgi:hypothetical protein
MFEFHFLSLLPSLPPCNIFLHFWLFFAVGSIHQEAQAVKFNCSCTSDFTDCSCLLLISSSIVSCTSGLLRLQLSSSIFSSSIVSCTSGLLRLKLSSIFSSSIVTVLPDNSGYNCFLCFFFKFNGFFRSFLCLSTSKYLA